MDGKNNYLSSTLNILRRTTWYVLLFSLFINLLMLTVPIYMMQIFDRVLASHSTDTLIFLTIIAIFFLCIFTGLELIRNKIGLKTAEWLDVCLSTRALCHSPDLILTGNSYGGQVLHDITDIKKFLSSPSFFSLFDLPWLPFYLLLMFLLHPALGILSVIGTLLFISFAVYNDWSTKSDTQDASALNSKIRRETSSILRASDVIQAMGMMGNMINRWYDHNQKLQLIQSQATNTTLVIMTISKGIRLTLQVLILATGAYYVIYNQITPGTMIAASIIMSRALAPVEGAIGTWKQFLAARNAYNRLLHYFEFEKQQPNHELIEYPLPKGKLSSDNLIYFHPNKNLPTIKQITFEVESGTMLAIIGPTGSGKSTLAKLIVGSLQPRSGSVQLDGIDLYQWSRAHSGTHIGYLSQEINLFDGSIKENIVRFGECNDKWLIQAAQIADIYDVILKLPNSFDTQIGFNGIDLSMGQKQKIALARAFYGMPKLLVLDGPAINLDIKGEMALKLALKVLKQNGSTIVLNTHHPSLMEFVDKVLIINNGSLEHFGEKETVLQALKNNIHTNRSESNESL